MLHHKDTRYTGVYCQSAIILIDQSFFATPNHNCRFRCRMRRTNSSQFLEIRERTKHSYSWTTKPLIPAEPFGMEKVYSQIYSDYLSKLLKCRKISDDMDIENASRLLPFKYVESDRSYFPCRIDSHLLNNQNGIICLRCIIREAKMRVVIGKTNKYSVSHLILKNSKLRILRYFSPHYWSIPIQ